MEERKDCYVAAEGYEEIFYGLWLFVVFDNSLGTVEINEVEEDITYTVENPCFPKSVASENLACKNNGTEQD